MDFGADLGAVWAVLDGGGGRVVVVVVAVVGWRWQRWWWCGGVYERGWGRGHRRCWHKPTFVSLRVLLAIGVAGSESLVRPTSFAPGWSTPLCH